jgi:N6-adenosine-specific RNA methylase IME4
MKGGHSRKPDELYDIIEACCPAPRLELFARGNRKGWKAWSNEAESYYPTWNTYANHLQKLIA